MVELCFETELPPPLLMKFNPQLPLENDKFSLITDALEVKTNCTRMLYCLPVTSNTML